MNLERIAAALRLLADALEDKAEAVKERTAIQAEPPIAPAPTVNWTLEQVRSALGTMTKLTSRQAVLDKVGSIHLGSADQAELNRIMAALDMPEGASHE